MPGPPDDEQAPRWELPAPSSELPRWEPERGVPRWQPPADASPGSRFTPPAPGVRRVRARLTRPLARPFMWWRAPWLVVWAVVLLSPGAALVLRVADESGHGGFVQPLTWAYVALFVAALAIGLVASSRRSIARAGLGLVGSIVAVGVLLWPVTHVTLGRAPCPLRAGPDLGVAVAVSALGAWRGAGAADAAWRGGQSEASWRDRTRALSLLDYQLVDTGCWERLAPIDGSRTWHEFRVTVREGEGTPLSKVVVIQTEAGDEGWKITAIEGPLP